MVSRLAFEQPGLGFLKPIGDGMQIKHVELRQFKVFEHLTITALPSTARVVVLVGKNGSGKSCLFDAFLSWHGRRTSTVGYTAEYHMKADVNEAEWKVDDAIEISFHDSLSESSEVRKNQFYIRSAFRNEPDFEKSSRRKFGAAVEDDERNVRRLIDNDTHVSANYVRVLETGMNALFKEHDGSKSVEQLRKETIGELCDSFRRVFPNLTLNVDRLDEGLFFRKGTKAELEYMNLSGGEKSAFDLLLDFFVKKETYCDSIICIDEPDTHMHSSLQGRLLDELIRMLGDKSQLWVSTHSIGTIRKAMEMEPDSVAFLDFSDHNFDKAVTIKPSVPSRSFWRRVLKVALHDVAELVAPKTVVLCEGRESKDQAIDGFDAHCLRTIFEAEFPDTDFISVGNASDVQNDRLSVASSIQKILGGTKILRLIDRDDRTVEEIQRLADSGIRVMSRRQLESYLFDDEVLIALCMKEGQQDKQDEVLAAKNKAIESSVERGNQQDDIKSARGSIYNEVKAILNLLQRGNSAEAFCRDTLAPLIDANMEVYKALRNDIFGN